MRGNCCRCRVSAQLNPDVTATAGVKSSANGITVDATATPRGQDQEAASSTTPTTGRLLEVTEEPYATAITI